jgi:histidinol-phosphate aminotransferase
VSEALGRLAVDVVPSGANFVLFRPRPLDGLAVWKGLVERSVLVRDCSAWPRLSGCLRVTIGTPEENDTFLAALAEVLG